MSAAPAWRRMARHLWLASLPSPAPVRRAYRAALRVLEIARRVALRGTVLLWSEPALRSRADRVGRRLRLEALPRIVGPVRIEIGDDVSICGPIVVSSPPGTDARLVVAPRVFIGFGTIFHVASRMEIGEGAGIGARCYVADNDTHPRDLAARLRGEGPPKDEVKPVRIGRFAWLGRDCHVMKGVTIGEGAIVGAASVVVTDVPPWCIALGNPARVVARIDQAEALRDAS